MQGRLIISLISVSDLWKKSIWGKSNRDDESYSWTRKIGKLEQVLKQLRKYG